MHKCDSLGSLHLVAAAWWRTGIDVIRLQPLNAQHTLLQASSRRTMLLGSILQG